MILYLLGVYNSSNKEGNFSLNNIDAKKKSVQHEQKNTKCWVKLFKSQLNQTQQ